MTRTMRHTLTMRGITIAASALAVAITVSAPASAAHRHHVAVTGPQCVSNLDAVQDGMTRHFVQQTLFDGYVGDETGITGTNPSVTDQTRVYDLCGETSRGYITYHLNTGDVWRVTEVQRLP